MTITSQPIVGGHRYAEIRFGDTLQSIAARELGDASQWVQLIGYNSLVPPFITGDATQAGPGVLLYGATIRLPAPVSIVSAISSPDEVFGTDVLLDPQGQLTLANGDFGVVAGIPNLHQALSNRIKTEAGELIFHLDYGSQLPGLIGTVNGPIAEVLGENYLKAALLADSRVATINSVAAQVNGDSLSVSAEVQPISDRVLVVQATF